VPDPSALPTIAANSLFGPVCQTVLYSLQIVEFD
jgi:hypothetical protein